MLREMEELRETVLRLRAPRVLVGSSPRMAQVRARIAQVAPTDAPVLITGESGTGKEVCAEAIHQRSGPAGRCRAIRGSATSASAGTTSARARSQCRMVRSISIPAPGLRRRVLVRPGTQTSQHLMIAMAFS
jgi:hypothetical protein